MKRCNTTLLLLFVMVSLFAQTPQKMSYQAVVRNNSNQLVKSQTVGLKLTILQTTPAGTVLYTETQTPITNENGLLSIQFGGGVGFDTINWQMGPFYLKTEIDPAGGVNYTIEGTTQLLSVPFSFYSQNTSLIYKKVNKIGFGTSDKLQVGETDGTLYMNNVSSSILFPSVTGTPGPMIYLFSANSNNADRMIFGHSPNYPTWGLQYEDKTDEFHFVKPGYKVFTIDLTHRRVGVNNPDPEVDLDIIGKIKITDGTQTKNYVLTADSLGIGTWKRPAGSHYVGENFGGGIVFFVYDNGAHGLIAQKEDSPQKLPWSAGSFITTYALHDGLNGGESNTNIIISRQGTGNSNIYAAAWVASININDNGITYSDWYLPSAYELNLLYQQRVLVGNFVNESYLSSTEFSIQGAYNIDFSTGIKSIFFKDVLLNVRGIRKF